MFESVQPTQARCLSRNILKEQHFQLGNADYPPRLGGYSQRPRCAHSYRPRGQRGSKFTARLKKVNGHTKWKRP
jgi:hypothetical protein